MESSKAAGFRIGKINSKNLIFEILSYSHYLKQGTIFLSMVSKQLRKMLVENYFYALNSLIPSQFNQLDFNNIPRVKVYSANFSAIKVLIQQLETIEE